MINAFSAANTREVYRSDGIQDLTTDLPIYVPQLILLKDGPVTITTMKLKIQLDAVLNALAGALIRNPTISAG